MKKIGNIYEVQIDENHKKYFQYIASDGIQINSEVIRVFETKYSLSSRDDLQKLVRDPVDFHCHCFIKSGLEINAWKLVGNVKTQDITSILFRDTNDYGAKPGEQVTISKNWYIWRLGDGAFEQVGELLGANREAEIGIVINPNSIVYRMVNGLFDFKYPDFR